MSISTESHLLIKGSEVIAFEPDSVNCEVHWCLHQSVGDDYILDTIKSSVMTKQSARDFYKKLLVDGYIVFEE